ncbi:MAG: arsenic transporter [Nocardioidaceae bacterium]|nr:arsenic transporter [Nocardioidaceae bacterium]
MLAVAFAHPRARVELAVGLVAAGVVLACGAVGPAGALDQVRLLFPVVAFLAAILAVAELCAVEGVFAAVGALVRRAGRGDPRRMLLLTFAAAAAVTAVLSLDATVVLLTPVVAVAAAGASVSPRPLVHACARLANSASLLLPVSNLTNLLAMPSLPLSFAGFALLMAPVWVAVLAVEYAGHRLYFARDLATRGRADAAPEPVHLPVVPVVVVALMLVGFAVLSPLGVAPAWVAAAAAVALATYSLSRRRVRVAAVVHAAHPSFAAFVLCLGVVVAGLTDTFLGDLVRRAVPGDDSLGSLLLVALVATVLANLVNNLPATLLLVPIVAPLGVTTVLAALVGLGVGSGLTYTGSLANLLWRRTLLRRGGHPSGRVFHRLAAVVTLPAVAVGVLVLWAWAPVVGH